MTDRDTIRQLCRAAVAHTLAADIARERARPDHSEHVVAWLIARAPRVSNTEYDAGFMHEVETLVRGLNGLTE